MKAKSKQSWEKEFDSADLKDWIFDDRKELSPDRVKSFIRTLLQKEREKWLKELNAHKWDGKKWVKYKIELK